MIAWMGPPVLSPARRGAELLDREYPGWREKITRPVRVADVRDCPLGQVYGTYGEGIMTLRLAGVSVSLLGFSDSHGFSDGSTWYKDSPTLDQEWEQIVHGRQLALWRRLTGRAA
jgi:hypothetical protein